MGLSWGEGGGWLSGGCGTTEQQGVALVLSVERVAVEVHRLEAGQGSFAVAVYAPASWAPTEVLVQAKPLLSDGEASQLARALGF